MGQAYFYHLVQRPIEATLPTLLGKALEAGWRVSVRGTDANRMAWLDEKLWVSPEDGFLPHGLAGGAHDGLQPILLGVGASDANSATCVMCVDGANVESDEVESLERVCVLFDGNDDEAVSNARIQWKTLVDAGCGAQYWSDADGRWEKKAER